MSLTKAFVDYFILARSKGHLKPWNQNININNNNNNSKIINKEFKQPKKLKEEKFKSDDYNIVKEKKHLIGKGSKFESNLISDFLKPLNEPSLIRSNGLKRFNSIKALNNHRLVKTLKTNKDTELHETYHNLSKEIISTLSEITPKAQSYRDISPISLSNKNFFFLKKKQNKHIYTEIPKIPNFKLNDSLKFEQYIFKLTHSTFHFKNSSKFNGIIPKILKNLFHPLNSNTLKLRTLNSYNSYIHYFSYKFNFATAYEMFLQMKSEGTLPNITTYNLLLMNVLKTSNIPHTSNHYQITLKYLREIKRMGLQADLITWNIIQKIFKDDLSKTNLIYQRSKLNLPLDTFFIKEIFTSLIQSENSNTIYQLLEKTQMSLDIVSFNIILKLLIKESHYKAAYTALLTHPSEFNFKVNTLTMNLFLCKFSKQGRLDLCYGIMNTFKENYQIKPNFETYNLIMKCLATMGIWQNKVEILRILYHEMIENCNGIISGNYWLLRIRSRLNFIDLKKPKNSQKRLILSSPLTNKEIQIQNFIKNYKFDQFLEIYPNEKNIKFMKILGYYSLKNSKKFDSSIQYHKYQAKTYKNRINSLGIQKSMKNRVQYVEGKQYSSLKIELKERGII